MRLQKRIEQFCCLIYHTSEFRKVARVPQEVALFKHKHISVYDWDVVGVRKVANLDRVLICDRV